MSAITSSSTPMRIGRVSLVVRDLQGVAHFYRSVLGMDVVANEDRAITLGAGQVPLLKLIGEPDAPARSRHDAGLFHTAFLLPTRADLGRWINFAAKAHIAISGASDHSVSEALYLADPEGNGIEIYADRRSSAWHYQEGALQMRTDPLDIDSLRAEAVSTEWEGMPTGSVIGHVHLQVGDIPTAEEFYTGKLGFEITARYPGASFYGSGGYHHHLGTNIWNSRNAAPKQPGSAGLSEVEILVGDDVTFQAAQASAGVGSGEADGAFTVRDPWGTSFTFRQSPTRV